MICTVNAMSLVQRRPQIPGLRQRLLVLGVLVGVLLMHGVTAEHDMAMVSATTVTDSHAGTANGHSAAGDMTADDMGGMDHSIMGDGGMAGMMTPEDMQALTKASGAEFDQMWLEMMIEHHEGAIDMARTELADGESTDAKALAQDIIDAQQAEITAMKGLL